MPFLLSVIPWRLVAILGVMAGLADVTLERRILGSYPRGEAL